MKNAVIYARVSTLTQKQNETIDSQLKRLKAYCWEHNLMVVDIYKDEAITGASEERIVNLVKYLQDNHKRIDCLVCTYFDRVARDTYLQLWLDKECQKLDIEIISTEQDLFNNTRQDPLQEAMKEMMYVFAKLEKNIIAKRLKGGRAHKATARGIKSQGNCPLGYEYEGKTTKEKHVVINSKEEEVVKKIFRTFLDTRSTTRTARAINTMGYTTKRGKAFSRQTIQTILQNDFYTGMISYNGEQRKGDHQPIISKHLFTKAQKLFRA